MSLTREAETLQPLADQTAGDQTAGLGPSHYFSDGYEVYRTLLYRQGQHRVAPGKSETYSVEGDNADLRHYPTKTLLGAFGTTTWRVWDARAGVSAASWRHWRGR